MLGLVCLVYPISEDLIRASMGMSLVPTQDSLQTVVELLKRKAGINVSFARYSLQRCNLSIPE